MEDNIKMDPAAVLATARDTQANIVRFLEEMRKQSPSGERLWAVVLAPETLHGLVTQLAYLHACGTVLRPNTHVSAEDINAFLDHQIETHGGRFFRLRKPALHAELFGVPFIAAQNVPPGVLCPVPAAAPAEVTVTVDTLPAEDSNGATAKGVGEASPGPA